MAHRYIIYPNLRLIVLAYRGDLDESGLKEVSHRIWSEPHYDIHLRSIIDYRECSFNLNKKQLDAFCGFLGQNPSSSRGRAALIVDKPLPTAMDILFAKSLGTPNQISIFCTWEAACHFQNIKLDPPDWDSEPGSGMGRVDWVK